MVFKMFGLNKLAQKVNHTVVLNVGDLIVVIIKIIVHIMNNTVVPICIGINDLIFLNIGNDNDIFIRVVDVIHDVHCIVEYLIIKCFNLFILSYK